MQKFTSLEYLKIDIASNFGLNKKDWDERIAWFDEHEGTLATLANMQASALKIHPVMKAAAEPALFYAGIQAYAVALSGGDIGYPISLDATASGAQILSVLIGCGKSASNCNVVDSGKREDLYKNIHEGMETRMGTESGVIAMDAIKQAIMTSLYGSEKEPKNVFGEGEQLACFYQTMEEEVPGIWELNTEMLSLWQPEAFSHDWVLPDNFHTKNKVMGKRQEHTQFFNAPIEVTTAVNEPQEKGRSMGANITHSIDGMIVREMSRRGTYDPLKVKELLLLISTGSKSRPHRIRAQDELVEILWAHYKRTGFLSARIINTLDADNIGMIDSGKLLTLLESLPKSSFEIMSVHDCFRCHPNYGNDLRQQYANILADLNDSTILADIASQMLREEIVIEKRGLHSDHIRNANYQLS